MTTGSKPEDLDDDALSAATGGIDPNKVAMQIKPQMVDTTGLDATGLREQGSFTGIRAADMPTGLRVGLKK